MCKFHQDIATDVARRPDGTIDPLALAVNIVALGTNFSIQDVVPGMPGISGFNTYELASQRGQDNFARSGIVYDPKAFALYQSETLPFLQVKTKEVLDRHLIHSQTARYLKNEGRALDFVNTAPDELYEPFDQNMPQDVFKKASHVKKYAQLREMAADYWDDPDVRKILSTLFKQSVAVTFTDAKEKALPLGLWLHERLKPVKENIISMTPGWMKTPLSASNPVASIGCGNVLFHTLHYGAFPAFGAAAPALLSFGINGTFILGAELWDTVSGHPMSKLGRSVLYGAALISSMASAVYHDMFHDQAAHDHNNENSSISYFNDEAGRCFMVREEQLCLLKKTAQGDSAYALTHVDTIQVGGPLKVKIAPQTP